MTESKQEMPTGEGDGHERGADIVRFDVVLRAMGERVVVDHGYALFGAIARATGDDLHGAWWLAVAGLRGVSRSKGELGLSTPGSELRLRVTQDRVAWATQLAGRELSVRGDLVRLGVSQTFTLRPSRTLRARVVTTKVHGDVRDAEVFRKALTERVRELGVRLAEPGVRGARLELGERRVVRVSEELVVGYQVTLYDLSDADSLKVLYAGVGGRRRFGCGVFMAPASEGF
ncbi:MAG: type I-MYXAN CRISPR-associated protein Cas6/Cmx6 [Deltaproteobacteria bacterium]|nr:type I-MYXAN CRISPR-associated protein Cas6/Cmx6 [Deltaproteobacteria bacterium]